MHCNSAKGTGKIVLIISMMFYLVVANDVDVSIGNLFWFDCDP